MKAASTLRWLQFGLATLLALLFAGARAQTNPPYFDVTTPEQLTSTDKIEVVEAFSYACIHCAQFQGFVDAWRKTADSKKIEFMYLPATYNQTYPELARGFYAADNMGITAKTHQAVFDAIHMRGVRIRSFADVVELYVQLGAPRQDFIKAAGSFFVETQFRRAAEFMIKYHVDSTPTLIVAGKYRITPDSAGGQENMFKVVDQLVAQELAQRKATSRQAPKSGK